MSLEIGEKCRREFVRTAATTNQCGMLGKQDSGSVAQAPLWHASSDGIPE